MSKKIVLFFVFAFLFISMDIILSPILKIYFSFIYISYIISLFDAPYIFYSSVIFGIFFDMIFAAYIGPYTVTFFLMALFTYLIHLFYDIKKFFLRLLLVPICFIPSLLINRSIKGTLYSLLFTEIIALAIYPLLDYINKRISNEKA